MDSNVCCCWIDMLCFGMCYEACSGKRTEVEDRLCGFDCLSCYSSLNSCYPFKCEICHVRTDPEPKFREQYWCTKMFYLPICCSLGCGIKCKVCPVVSCCICG